MKLGMHKTGSSSCHKSAGDEEFMGQIKPAAHIAAVKGPIQVLLELLGPCSQASLHCLLDLFGWLLHLRQRPLLAKLCTSAFGSTKPCFPSFLRDV